MRNIIEQKLNDSRFGKLFPDFATLKGFVKDINNHRKKGVSEMYSFEHSESTTEERVAENQRSLAKKESEVPMLLAAIDNASDDEVKTEYEQNLHELNDEIKGLRASLSKNSPFVTVRNTFKFAKTSTETEEMDAWMEKVGQWFETGVLGEGSVTYNGKTYTYPKQA